MRKMMIIAARDYRAAVLSKAFLISLVALPIIWGGSAAAQIFLKDKVDTAEKRFAIIDQTAGLYDYVAAAAQRRNETEIFEGEGANRKQVRPRFVLESVEPGSDLAQTKLHLSDRVRNQQLFGFVEIGGDVLAPASNPERSRLFYYSNSPTYDDFTQWFKA